jgi:hypothetical protein
MAQDERGDGRDKWFCICLECGTSTPRQNLVTCLETNCPTCGAVMVREGSPYYEYAMRRRRLESSLWAALARRGVNMKSGRAAEPSPPVTGQTALGEVSLR